VPGRLLVNLVPWAQASVDGATSGARRSMTLAPGRIRSTLANPDLGQRGPGGSRSRGADTNITDW
jgi:hypothetical protein